MFGWPNENLSCDCGEIPCSQWIRDQQGKAEYETLHETENIMAYLVGQVN